MKKFAFTLVCQLFISLPLLAQWQQMGNSISQLDLYDIWVDGDELYAVGYVDPSGGTFLSYHLHSTNGGETWESRTVDGEFHKAIEKKGAWQLAGFTPAGKSFIKSSADGKSWTEILSNSSTTGLTDIFYITDKIGFASGYGEMQFSTANIFKTTDGGETWKEVAESLPTTTFDEIQFLDEENGFALSSVYFGGRTLGNQISHTTDGGKNWEILHAHLVDLGGMFFLSKNEGFLVDMNGEIHKTEDGGENWNRVHEGSGQPLFDIQFDENGRVGIAIGGAGTAFITSDGGENWEKQTTNSNESLIRAKFSDGKVYCVGSNGTILSHAISSSIPKYGVQKIDTRITENAVLLSSDESLANLEFYWVDLLGRRAPASAIMGQDEVTIARQPSVKSPQLLYAVDKSTGQATYRKLLAY